MAKQNPVQEFKQKLAKLKAKYPKRKEFWAGIGPVWTEEEVAAFEKKEGVKLPKEYRQFLLEVGDGAGFAWHGHEECVKKFVPLRKLAKSKKLYRLNKPFLLTQIWWGEPPRSLHNQKLPRGAWQQDGTIPMGISEDHGQYFLVVNGKGAGKIWVDLSGNEGSPIGSTKKSFMQLNLDWINDTNNFF